MGSGSSNPFHSLCVNEEPGRWETAALSHFRAIRQLFWDGPGTLPQISFLKCTGPRGQERTGNNVGVHIVEVGGRCLLMSLSAVTNEEVLAGGGTRGLVQKANFSISKLLT